MPQSIVFSCGDVQDTINTIIGRSCNDTEKGAFSFEANLSRFLFEVGSPKWTNDGDGTELNKHYH